MKTDVHQHLWTEPLVEALAARNTFPFIARENGLNVLYLHGERPYVIDLLGEAPERRSELVERDGLDRALVCLSSPLGIEWLPPVQAGKLLDAYHDGALSLGGAFGAWGAIALNDPDPDEVDSALTRGCIGLSLPAGAIGSVDGLQRLRAVLDRLEQRGAPLLVHPGPGPGRRADRHGTQTSLGEPLWWPALTSYVAGMQQAWLAFGTAGRSSHPDLRVIFTMLAGLAPLQAERLRSRGGPAAAPDPLVFYDTSSYGPTTVRVLADIVGAGQLLYGSDRPVVDPGELDMPARLDWDPVLDATRRALGSVAVGVAR
jgi:6-methylsalicylate decarboxylase